METNEGHADDDAPGPLARLFHPGPLKWLLGLSRSKPRFHAGQHMHGLDDHNIHASERSAQPHR